MTGVLDMSGQYLIKPKDPNSDNDVDDYGFMKSKFLQIKGGHMNAAIDMWGNLIHKLGDGVPNDDAVNRG